MFTFKIKCSKWQRMDGKSLKTMPSGKLFFSQFIAKNRKSLQETEDWMAAVEYLRTKVTFETFVNNYGKVPFPSQMNTGQGSGSL